MERRDQSGKNLRPPRWNSPFWYLPVIFLLLWFWQSAIMQLAYRTIPYSEFKEHLRNGEIPDCVVKEAVIEGTVQPKAPATPAGGAATNAPAAKAPAKFFFHTVRVEDSNLVSELEAAHVKFNGVRPGFMSEFLLAWILPIGVVVLIWLFIG